MKGSSVNKNSVNKNSVNKNIVYIIVAIVIGVTVLIFSQYSSFLGYTPSEVRTGAQPMQAPSAGTEQPKVAESAQTQQTTLQTTEQTQTITETVTTQPKEFTVHGKSFSFDPKTITVNKGDKVKITFISDDVSHDICVEGYGCSQVISKGQTTTLEFVAKDSGSPKFYCSVDGHRQFGMEGDFVIQ